MWGGGGVEKGASSLGKHIFPIYKYIITYKISFPVVHKF